MTSRPGRDSQPLGEKLFQQIVELIQSGELAPGSEVNEVSLAEQFEVSRGPVREALRRLQGVGLISREPYFRARVVLLDPAQVVELFQMREALEGMACRLAAERMTAEDAAKLLTDLEADRKRWVSESGETKNRAFDFHQRVVEGSQNHRIAATLNGDLHELFRLYRRRSGADIQRKAAAYSEHWQIARAIISRDPDLAESLMRSHVSRAAANLVGASQAPLPVEKAEAARTQRRSRKSA